MYGDVTCFFLSFGFWGLLQFFFFSSFIVCVQPLLPFLFWYVDLFHFLSLCALSALRAVDTVFGNAYTSPMHGAAANTGLDFVCAAMTATAQTLDSGGTTVRSTSTTVRQASVSTMGPALMASRCVGM